MKILSVEHKRFDRKRTDMQMSKPMVTIENWAVVKKGTYVAYEELEPGNVLTGQVFGHSSLPNAKSVFTSPIISIDNDNCVVETRNTLYLLGEPSADYKSSDEYRNWEGQRKSRFAA
jgi:hypothetical protein